MARSCSGWSTSDYFSRSDTGIKNEPFTLACWAITATASSGATLALMNLGNNGASGTYMLFVNATGSVRAQKQQDDGTAAAAVSGHTMSDNVWTFCAGLFTSNTSRQAYAAGTLGSAETTSLTDPTVDFQSIGIRLRDTPTLPWNGSIALPTIWDVVLSEGELDALNAGMHPARIRPKNIVRAWWMPTAGSRLVDFSGGQNTLSLTGSVTNDAFGPPVEPYIYGHSWPRNAPLIEEAATGWGQLLGQRRNRLVA